MNRETLFSETQAFRHWAIWLPLLGLDAFVLYGGYRQWILGEPWGDDPLPDAGLALLLALMLAVTALFLLLRLDTRIDREGVHVRYLPFHRRFRHFPWERITSCQVRRYSPIGEYGGWGLRLGLFGKGDAYNVSGNRGLQLEFSDRRPLLIGTRRPDELQTALASASLLKP